MLMDSLDPQSFHHRTETLSTGRTYHFIDQQPANGCPGSKATLLCIHGFPDSWYGWRHQIGPWTRKGYRVIAPDMLGYGQSDMPSDSNEYSTKKICADMAALLDLVGVDCAVLIGHDWGSVIAGRFALWHPDRLKALVLLSVAYYPPSKDFTPLPEVVKRIPNYGYQLYFADDISTAEIGAVIPLFLKLIYKKPGRSDMNFTAEGNIQRLLSTLQENDLKDGCLLNEREFEYYVSQYHRGMFGPLSYYRVGKLRFEEEKAAALPSSLSPDLPVFFMFGSKDPTRPPLSVQVMQRYIPNLQMEMLEDTSHFVMVEAPDAVTEGVHKWLELFFASSTKL